MKPQKDTGQLSLFNDTQNSSLSKETQPITPNKQEKTFNKEVKVISLMDYKLKKAEERFNSYADHII